MDMRSLSERDICTKFMTPALRKAGWGVMLQIREEVSFTKGRIIVRGKLVTRHAATNGWFVRTADLDPADNQEKNKPRSPRHTR